MDVSDQIEEAVRAARPLAATETIGSSAEGTKPMKNKVEWKKVPGVVYVVPYSEAVAKQWSLSSYRPAGRSGQFVDVRQHMKGKHNFLSIPTLPEEFEQASMAPVSHIRESESQSPVQLVRDNALVFPEIDRILAKSLPDPLQFVEDITKEELVGSKEALGPVAEQFSQHCADCSSRGKWKDLTNKQIAVHKFDTLLTLVQSKVNRGGDLLWLGCPTLPEQLLYALQLSLQDVSHEDWTCPPAPDIVDLIGRVEAAVITARALTEQIRMRVSVDWSEVRDLIKEHKHLRMETRLIGTHKWEDVCRAADRVEFDSLMEILGDQLEQYVDDAIRPSPSSVLGIDTGGNQPTLMLRTEPKEGRPKLTPEETKRLNEYLKRDATRDIDISQARLLTEASGTEICALQAGGSDLAPIALSEVLKDFIMAVKQELCPETSIRCIPAVALAKILTLRLMPSDNIIFEHFGYISWRDTSMNPQRVGKVKGLYREMYALQAKKDIWAPIETIDDLGHVMDGIRVAVRRMLHPSILSADEIAEMWDQIKQIWVCHGGRARVASLSEAIKARLEEHAQMVRRRVAGSAERVPPLTEWGQRSNTLLQWAVKSAETACIAAVASDGGDTGETASGKERLEAKGIDADGKKVAYKRKDNNPTVIAQTPGTGRGGGYTSGGPSVGHFKTTPDNGSKRRKLEHREDDICLKCGGSGHRMMECTAPNWCAIQTSWPKPLQIVAKNARLSSGVKPVWQKVEAAPNAGQAPA